ncbi:MAG: hypothetical protein AB7E37_01595 [Candidatus Altimarinota bacterium]
MFRNNRMFAFLLLFVVILLIFLFVIFNLNKNSVDRGYYSSGALLEEKEIMDIKRSVDNLEFDRSSLNINQF